MTLLHRLASIVRWMIHRNRAERDLNDELEAFVDLAAADRLRDGATPAEARRLAVLHLGGVEQAKERVRTDRHGAWLDEVGRDVRYGFRTLRRSPVFTTVALLTLTLGIGANIAIFTILNSVILRPLGYSKPEQLMFLTTQFPALTYAEYGLSPPEYMELRDMTRSFANIGAFTTGEVNLTAGNRPHRLRSASVDEHLLPVLGFRPAMGRFFAAGETDPAAATPGLPPAIAVLSYELWHTAFGGSDLVGRTVEVDGRPYEVIGIAPAGADVIDNRTEIWLAIGLQPNLLRVRDAHFLSVIGRLKDGVAVQMAQSELEAVVEGWAEQ
jgi:hypothetical protein